VVIRLLIGVPLLVVLVLFALSNTNAVRISLWPTDYSLQAPLSMAILGAMGVAFLFGGLVAWISALAQRRRARRAENRVQLLEAQVQDLKSRLTGPAMPRQAA